MATRPHRARCGGREPETPRFWCSPTQVNPRHRILGSLDSGGERAYWLAGGLADRARARSRVVQHDMTGWSVNHWQGANSELRRLRRRHRSSLRELRTCGTLSGAWHSGPVVDSYAKVMLDTYQRFGALRPDRGLSSGNRRSIRRHPSPGAL